MTNTADSSRDTVLVPDMDAAAITAFANKGVEGELTLNWHYGAWDYLLDLDKKPISGRGKRFEVMTWQPGRDVSSDEVRTYFREKGFYGHTAAFIIWVAQHLPIGFHGSIPEDNACLRGPHGNLSAPVSRIDQNDERMDFGLVGTGWNHRYSFVAFRELPA